MGRTEPNPNDPVSDLGTTFPQASAALESAVHDLISSGWEEVRRRQAHEMALALAQGAKAEGWKEAGNVLQAVASLLALPLEEVLPVREALREKLLELFDLLGDRPASETA